MYLTNWVELAFTLLAGLVLCIVAVVVIREMIGYITHHCSSHTETRPEVHVPGAGSEPDIWQSWTKESEPK